MNKDPYQGINWIKTTPIIHDKDGKVIFEKEVVFPDYFREQDIKIVASKYLCNAAKREEKSLRDMIDRVSDTISGWGVEDGYFTSDEEAKEFSYYLKYYQLHQYFAFNSPVYFNVGLEDEPQSSACFILSVEDNMESITSWLSNEGTIFKKGSGSGINLSNIRGSNELVKGGGTASGPISFLKGTDVFAGVIKSGGTLRRSAKLACLDMDHPDIEKFINCKDKEELKMTILREAGIKPEPGYEMSDEVFFQNTNISVRIDDKFIDAVKMNGEWNTINRLDGSIHKTYKAKKLLEKIAEHAWRTGDPGVQFHDNINKMNPIISDGEIEASNPCSEFMHLNNTSCNLASTNLKKFINPDTNLFDTKLYEHVIKIVIQAQDILIDKSSYPIPEIEKNTKKYRPLGCGYSNLGALLMSRGLSYDSDEGRDMAALITAFHQGVAYKESKRIASVKGAPKWWTLKNKKSMYDVLDKHYNSLLNVRDAGNRFSNIKDAAIGVWQQLLSTDDPIQNSQASVLAPTGTISFLMGCDTQGIEPDFALLKFKTLSGSDGATIATINLTVKEALIFLGYSDNQCEDIIRDIKNGIPIESQQIVKKQHKAVFDTANPPLNGKRSISYMGHLKMMAAVQPFISGAISKTVNLPNDATIEDMYNTYLQSWEMGLKSVAIYRDGSKDTQVLSTSNKKDELKGTTSIRRKMPTNRDAGIHKFVVNHSINGYVITGEHENGDLGEVFVKIAKDGSTLTGLFDALATIVSISLQHGVPLKSLVKKMIHRKFEPAGFTDNPQIRSTTSLVDYMFKFLAYKYCTIDEQIELGLTAPPEGVEITNKNITMSANPCPKCGAIMRRLGSCEQCDECGFSGGSCG